MQHRAALRAKARRRNAERRRLLWPAVVILAGVRDIQVRGRHARFMAAARLWGEYIRDRLTGPSFAEQIFQPVPPPEENVIDTDETLRKLASWLGVPLFVPAGSKIVYEILYDENDEGMVELFYAKDDGTYIPFMQVDKETFDRLRNVSEES